jgi:hypothetical protein
MAIAEAPVRVYELLEIAVSELLLTEYPASELSVKI